MQVLTAMAMATAVLLPSQTQAYRLLLWYGLETG